jgi:2-dehydro-3-deoxygluconokinase
MMAADVPEAMIAAAKILHVSGIGLAISETMREAVMHAVKQARASQTLVSFDTNLRLRLWPLGEARAAIHALVPMSDILKTSLEDGQTLSGHQAPEAIARFYRELGAGVVVVTLGPDGVLVSHGNESAVVTGRKVECVDATGAGDAFTGAFLAELCRGAEIAEAARFANAAAALSTREFGAVAGLPSRQDVEAFLRS